MALQNTALQLSAEENSKRLMGNLRLPKNMEMTTIVGICYKIITVLHVLVRQNYEPY
jgi:hypothetical protein